MLSFRLFNIDEVLTSVQRFSRYPIINCPTISAVATNASGNAGQSRTHGSHEAPTTFPLQRAISLPMRCQLITSLHSHPCTDPKKSLVRPTTGPDSSPWIGTQTIIMGETAHILHARVTLRDVDTHRRPSGKSGREASMALRLP